MNHRRIANILLTVGLAVCLLQVWLPAFYLTGDGPCHVANAKIMGDICSNNATAFYDHYYTLAYRPCPNWISHIWLAAVMLFSNGAIAEKILLTCYILLFAGGFYLLLKRINNSNTYWPLVVFALVFHFPLVMGFYDFSLGVAFFLFMTLSWLSWLEKRKVKYILAFFLFTLLSFFSHPIAYLFGSVTCFLLTLSWVLSAKPAPVGRSLLSNCLVLFLCLAPCALFSVKFMNTEGGAGSFHFQAEGGRFLALLTGKFLLTHTERELIFAAITGMVIIGLIVLTLAARRRVSGLLKYDGFLAAFIVVLLVYLFFPGALFGGTFFNIRVALFVCILACCCIAYIPPFASCVVTVAAICLYVCSISFAIVRLPFVLASGRATEELLSIGKYIKPRSVLLPLFCRRDGVDEHGDHFSDQADIFAHTAQYLSAYKPLIVLDNYEAHTNYFPLLWKPSVDPYTYLSTNEGIEGLPPCADIGAYYRSSGVSVDYVVVWCFDPLFLQNDRFRQFYAQVQAGYHKIYTSPGGRAILFEKNNSYSGTPSGKM